MSPLARRIKQSLCGASYPLDLGNAPAASPEVCASTQTDQTKRRRINAALVFPPQLIWSRQLRKLINAEHVDVAKSDALAKSQTCSDHKYTCLGYGEPVTVSQTASRSSPPNHEPSCCAETKKGGGSPEATRSGTSMPVPDPSRAPHDARKAKEDPSHQEHGEHQPESSNSPGSSESPGCRIATLESLIAENLHLKDHSALISNRRTHVPYFRYFGPTAIVPGFKQMVVRVRETKKSNPSLSTDSASSSRSSNAPKAEAVSSTRGAASASNSIHFYDPEDNLPNSEVVTHLCEVFFTHLGCNFPFLQRNRFLQDLAEKRLEPVLVDAVCALAARFSLHPLVTTGSATETNHPHHGDVFAHRAMCAVVDALSCPTVAGVQACLMLAYEQFGSNHDSGLWMYLGISIRMAQDLGMQKLEGMKYRYGRVGLTPKSVKSGQAGRIDERQTDYDSAASDSKEDGNKKDLDLGRVRERERVDTFWSLFLVDRVISSGTGRPVTLRDDDIEIFFPLQSESLLPNGWPAPFPALIRIIHLYGRVTDLLNAIKEVNHVTPETLKQLAGMESDLTGIYQRLSPKLHFNAVNFQNYVKTGEGTNFILLHFWFHALIVLVHQPTLLHSFSGRIQQLFPNSRELSMSSAKTIADILAFTELIDAKSFIGTPFTSQPTYIAACAFLMESALYSMPSSRSQTPPVETDSEDRPGKAATSADAAVTSEQSSNTKHSLLAAAAKEHYQRCYKALKSLETYWEGTKYILNVLDQKSKGIWDPQLYTEEEMDHAIEFPPLGNGFASRAWQRMSTSKDNMAAATKDDKQHDIKPDNQPANNDGAAGVAPSPKTNATQAIGWALTGATGSSQPNLSFLYQMPATQPNEATMYSLSHYGGQYQPVEVQASPGASALSSFPHAKAPYEAGNTLQLPSQLRQNPLPNTSEYSRIGPGTISPSNPSFPLSNSDFSSQSPHGSQGSFQSALLNTTPTPYSYNANTTMRANHRRLTSNPFGDYTNIDATVPSMTIESQDIDMNTLQDPDTFPFPLDGEFMPWLEYLPEDILQYFGDQGYRPLVSPTEPPDQQSHGV
uniref:Xylanolytic transcriptional activator regulatory domain-containing protein n=1 Tax=Coccidioides posadasii RMSCC 3488 TaxID=454284 RepID=A0A0J6FSZ3_COCPO|nr:hypothetical protein CPAG_08819 [Coccidioides posadasii RMSCC 3488]